MNRKIVVAIAAVGLFAIISPAFATTRNITTRLGGKIDDVFKIAGHLLITKNLRIDGQIYRGSKAGTNDKTPVVINDKLQVKGDLTTKGRTVSGTKRYSGTFDTTQSGDFVSTMTYPYDCTEQNFAQYTSTVATHYKSLSIPEVKTAVLPDLRVYYKIKAAGIPIPVTFTPSQYPNNNDDWIAVSAYLNEGQVYFQYKSVSTTCAGTATTTISTTGEYQVIIQ